MTRLVDLMKADKLQTTNQKGLKMDLCVIYLQLKQMTFITKIIYKYVSMLDEVVVICHLDIPLSTWSLLFLGNKYNTAFM